MNFQQGLATNLAWCTQANAQYLAGDWHFGCLPHVNQSYFCCGDELIELREHGEQVMIYRKRALNDAADQMDNLRGLSDQSKTLDATWCAAKDRALEYLWLAFAEARVLAIGGLEVLRFGLQDLSCQVCWASEPQRSAQIARVIHRDLQAVMIRLGQLRYGLPAWEPCLPHWWQFLTAPFNLVNVSVRMASTVDRMLALRQWMESIAVSMTAVAGEFQSLSYLLHSASELPEVESSMSLEGQIRDVPFPNRQPGRVALFLHECAQVSYPKIDIITVGKEDCNSFWRKFPYASAGTSVMLPDAPVRVSCERRPTEDQLAQLTSFLDKKAGAMPSAGCSAAPVAAAFDPKVLGVQNVQSSKTLIFVCLHSTFCGGHGDRLFGLLSAYLAALLSGRAFYIDMRSPIPLSSVLSPKQSWPAISGSCMTYRWTSAEDQQSLDGDIQQFMTDNSEVLCVASNLRLFKSLLKYDIDQKFTRPGLLSGLFLDLFSLASMPRSLVLDFRRRLDGRKLIGIHFRAGNETTWSDPARHALSDLDLALTCAATVESFLNLQDSAWLLAADTLKIRQHPAVMQLQKVGKIVYLEDRPTHIDRSSPDVDGIYQSWAAWWVLAFETEALLLSHSNFGWSAAEIGQRRAFHFPSCRPADVTSP